MIEALLHLAYMLIGLQWPWRWAHSSKHNEWHAQNIWLSICVMHTWTDRRRLTQLYTKTCWNSIITTHVKVFINSTSGVNLGQDYMFVKQRPTSRVQETCLKTSEIIIFAILFSATSEKNREKNAYYCETTVFTDIKTDWRNGNKLRSNW